MVIWVTSLWWQVQWMGKNNVYQFLIEGGCIVLRGPYLHSYMPAEFHDAHPVQIFDSGWVVRKSTFPGILTMTTEDCLSPIEPFTAIWTPQKAIAFWPLAIATLVAVAVPRIHQKLADMRTSKLFHCPKCKYDRRGIPASAPCPECNTPNPDA